MRQKIKRKNIRWKHWFYC